MEGIWKWVGKPSHNNTQNRADASYKLNFVCRHEVGVRGWGL